MDIGGLLRYHYNNMLHLFYIDCSIQLSFDKLYGKKYTSMLYNIFIL